MNLRRAYLGWIGKRLAYLLPSQAAAVLTLWWILRHRIATDRILIPCLVITILLGAILTYLLLQTLRAVVARHRVSLQEARAFRRHLRSSKAFAAVSVLLLATLLAVPGCLREPEPRESDWSSLSRRPSMRSREIPPEVAASVPKEPSPAPLVREPERPAASPAPAPVPAPAPAPAAPSARSEPAIPPTVALEPKHLEYSARDFELPPELEVPSIPKLPALAQASRVQEPESAPDRPTLEEFREPARRDRFAWGLLLRPLPDERDPEGWPSPEARLQGFLLIGKDHDRVPGLEAALDLPFGRDDSVQAVWMTTRLPAPDQIDANEGPNWNHLTLAYVRRLTGYTSHADFDLAVGVGVTVDFFRPAQGIPDPGTDPKFSPYLSLDAAFWQYQVVGLLLHLGESIPTTLLGSSLGVTDFRAEIRWDLTEAISIRAGYKLLLLRYKADDVPTVPGTETLHGAMSGPTLSLDIRF